MSYNNCAGSSYEQLTFGEACGLIWVALVTAAAFFAVLLLPFAAHARSAGGGAQPQQYTLGAVFPTGVPTTTVYHPFRVGETLAPDANELIRRDIFVEEHHCEKLTVCFAMPLATGQRVTTTVRFNLTDTLLTCTADGDATEPGCYTLVGQQGCTIQLDDAVTAAPFSITSVSYICEGTGCPTASPTSLTHFTTCEFEQN
jgi:hypothetical protein